LLCWFVRAFATARRFKAGAAVITYSWDAPASCSAPTAVPTTATTTTPERGTPCVGCALGSEGPCKNLNGLCQDYVATGQCRPGFTECSPITEPPTTTQPAVDKSGCAKKDDGTYFGYELYEKKRLAASESASVTFPRLVDSPTLGGITKGVATAGTTIQACAEQCDKDFSSTNVAARDCLSFSFRPPPSQGKPGCILGVTGTVRDPTDVISEAKVQDYNHYVRNTNCTNDRRRRRRDAHKHRRSTEIGFMSIAEAMVDTYKKGAPAAVKGFMFVDMQVDNFAPSGQTNGAAKAEAAKLVFRRQALVLSVADPDHDGDMDVVAVVPLVDNVKLTRSTQLTWTRNADDDKAGRCAEMSKGMATYNDVCQSCAGDEVGCKP